MLPSNAATNPVPEDPTLDARARAEVAKLIESHVSYAHAISAEVLRKVPPTIEKKDLQGWAELGLVEASNSFDRTRGVQFKTFAYYRIKGAIYDGLRKMGWYPQGFYHQMRFEMAANEYMKDVTSEAPRSGSAENHLQDLKDLTGNLSACYMLSLETLPLEPEDTGRVSAEEQVLREEQQRNVRRSLAQLPETNRRVLEHCYFEGLTLEEAGRKLGLSKSWVCRLHAKSLEMLRKQLAVVSGARSSSVATFPGTAR